jgi:hypothetical protein
METAMTTKVTIRKPLANTAKFDFEPDELIDGRAPIEMMQHETIRHFTNCVGDWMNARGETYLIGNNLPVRPYSDNLHISLAPDLFFGYVDDITPFLMETGYNIWQVGKPPDLVLEVASRTTYQKDVNEKPAIYASMGIPEYWMFDPTGGELYGQALIGYKLVDGVYVPIEMTPNEHGILSGYSEVWGMRLCGMERRQREEVLRRQPHFVFYEEAYPAELLLQYPDTGLYVLNGMGVSAQYRMSIAEREVAETTIAERDATIAERNTEIAERDARIRELEEQIRRMRS